MSLLSIFASKKPQAYEQKGDAFCREGLWGNAKVAYERALDFLERRGTSDGDILARLEQKIGRVRESLAREHQSSAGDLVAGGYWDEARDLFALALELTRDARLTETLQEQLAALEASAIAADASVAGVEFEAPETAWQEGGKAALADEDGETFLALCGALPDAVQMAYLGYGRHFKTGYLALNDGDFETAVHHLSLALEENEGRDTYIPLELATALLNQGDLDPARRLLEPFAASHPDVLPAYQLLCEIYWESGEGGTAHKLLAAVPDDLKASVAVAQLEGETLRRTAGEAAARTFYGDFMESYGWQEPIALALAEVHEAMGDGEKARQVYRAIMDNCRSCRRRIDPFIKARYADLCFADGQRDVPLLELYLSLAQENGAHVSDCYAKVSAIYAALGNRAEAQRFQAFAQQLRAAGKEDA